MLLAKPRLSVPNKNERGRCLPDLLHLTQVSEPHIITTCTCARKRLQQAETFGISYLPLLPLIQMGLFSVPFTIHKEEGFDHYWQYYGCPREREFNPHPLTKG